MSESDARKQEATNAPEGIICRPGEGRTIGGITFKATGEETGGSIGFIEATTPPRPGHLAMFTTAVMSYSTSERGSSSSCSGSGKLRVRLERSSLSLGGILHAAKVIGSEPGKVLVAYIPGGQERSFEEFGRLPANVVAEKYDSEFVGPPL